MSIGHDPDGLVTVCPGSPDGQHVPDVSGAKITGVTTGLQPTVTVEMYCLYCDSIGTVTVSVRSVAWWTPTDRNIEDLD